ncbi:MAG: phenylalanine--tRNA ligase subunit beta [Bacteroidetes bacterium]|nr:phenylalanine--tRNA ligase subunit beta [Bacteroidota bacterium]
MKASYNWLKTLINLENITPQQVDEFLTSSGLEVEGVETFETLPGGLKGIVVGEVIHKEKHPDADKLSLTKVDIGAGEPLSIVCGAPNVEAGQKVLVATIGTKLYPTEGEPFEIKKSKIRGAVSEGMICAEDEIGVGKSHAGIMVLPADTITGTPASEVFKIETDYVFEIGLTPNRADAASHYGVARDLSAILNTHVQKDGFEARMPGIHELPEATNLNKVEISIGDAEGCKRYSGVVISGITVQESPQWLQNRLKAIGLRPINNVVDITNFVLHELGQPLHAFDLGKIKGNKIEVRTCAEGTLFKTLDGVERKLAANDLMICNAEEPMCIAGVFGGLDSGVTENTKAIFIESAYFDPGYVRRTAKNHGLKTDSSFRFERGTDPNMVIDALKRAAALVLELAGGVVSMGVTDLYPQPLEPFKVAFSYDNCTALIGKNIDRAAIRQIILSLGIGIASEGADSMLLSVPRYKTDVTREADVVEEVMRIYGYNHVEPSAQIKFTASYADREQTTRAENVVASLLVSFGFYEIMGLSLTKSAYYSNPEGLVNVVNPLSSDLDVMRKSMLYGGLEALAYNINRKSSDLKFFEFGKTYTANSEAFPYSEEKHLSLFVTGRKYAENPYGENNKVNFSYLKACVERLLERLQVSFKTEEHTDDNLTYALELKHQKKTLAVIGLVQKSLAKKFDIQSEVFFADINWNHVLSLANKKEITYQEISKFPAVRRDLALLIDKTVKYNQLEELAFATERKLLKEVNLFDIYEGDKLEAGKKSYALSFILQDEQATLTDKQIDAVMQKLIKTYTEKAGASLRS